MDMNRRAARKVASKTAPIPAESRATGEKPCSDSDILSQAEPILNAECLPPPPKSEEALQALWADFLRVSLPPDAAHHHSPNEGRRGWRAQRALKSSGCAAGWPDSEIVYGGRVFFLELKMPRNKPTKIQSDKHEQLRRAGAPVGIGTSLAELAAHLVAWGVPLRLTVAEYERLRTAGRMTAAQYRAMQPTTAAAAAPKLTPRPKAKPKRRPLNMVGVKKTVL